MLVDKDRPTDEQMALIDQIAPAVRRARHSILLDYKQPGILQVSPEIFKSLCPDGPIFVYAAPFPKLMGLEVHPNPDLRYTQIAVTERI